MREVQKPWGYEIWFAHTDKYVGKLLFVKSGHRLSLQYHKIKDETLYLYYGLVEISDGVSVSKLGVGEAIHFPPMTRHRITALKDSLIFEVSTPEVYDVERIEDDYGRVD